VGWLAASGLAWDGLQLAAWANMAWRNAATMDGATALRQAVTGAPCEHCLTIREARKQADAGAPAAEASKRVASDLAPPGHPFPFLMMPRAAFAHPADLVAETRAREVDVPPPRAEVA
jgi:hypothetical protein